MYLNISILTNPLIFRNIMRFTEDLAMVKFIYFLFYFISFALKNTKKLKKNTVHMQTLVIRT